MSSESLSPRDVQSILASKRTDIIEQIKFSIDTVLDHLIQYYAIHVDQSPYDEINAGNVSKRERARKLLDYLSTGGEEAYLSFKKALKETQRHWLLRELENEEKKTVEERARCSTMPALRVSNPPFMRSQSVMSVTNPSCSYVQSVKQRFENRPSDTTVLMQDRRQRLFGSRSLPGSIIDFSEDPHLKGTYPKQQGASFADRSAMGNASSDEESEDETAVKTLSRSLDHLDITGQSSFPSSPNTSTDRERSLNMLLVGCKGNGKSNTGNSIVGQKFFVSDFMGGTSKASLGFGSFHDQCDNALWDIKVVDTPGISQEMTKSEFEEIVDGVKILSDDSSPRASLTETAGLDAIVLIWSCVHTHGNTGREFRAFESLKRLFGDALYERLVIVVTHGSHLSSVEDYVGKLPGKLREIARNCSGRLVTFENNMPLEDNWQSREVLFNVVYKLSQNQQRFSYSDLCKVSKCTIPGGSELRLALIGKTGSGKSSTGNSILGCEKFVVSGSATSETVVCTYYKRQEPREVTIGDTPGLLCNKTHVFDKDRLADTLYSIAVTYQDKGLHSMLLVVSGKGERFTWEDRYTVKCLEEVFSRRLLQHYTIIVVTGKDNMEKDKRVAGDEETYLRNAPRDFQRLIELCGNRVVFFNNNTEDETIQRMQVSKLIRMVDDLVETNGGPYIDDNFRQGRVVAEDNRTGANHPQSAKTKSISLSPSSALLPVPIPEERPYSEDDLSRPRARQSEVYPGLQAMKLMYTDEQEVDDTLSDTDADKETFNDSAIEHDEGSEEDESVARATGTNSHFTRRSKAKSTSQLHVSATGPSRQYSVPNLLPNEVYDDMTFPDQGQEGEISSESDQETITSNQELVPSANDRPRSIVEDQLSEDQSQESQLQEGPKTNVGTPPLQEDVSRHRQDNSNDGNDDGSDTAPNIPDLSSQVPATSNFRLTDLWKSIRRKLNWVKKRNTVAPSPIYTDAWTQP